MYRREHAPDGLATCGRAFLPDKSCRPALHLGELNIPCCHLPTHNCFVRRREEAEDVDKVQLLNRERSDKLQWCVPASSLLFTSRSCRVVRPGGLAGARQAQSTTKASHQFRARHTTRTLSLLTFLYLSSLHTLCDHTRASSFPNLSESHTAPASPPTQHS